MITVQDIPEIFRDKINDDEKIIQFYEEKEHSIKWTYIFPYIVFVFLILFFVLSFHIAIASIVAHFVLIFIFGSIFRNIKKDSYVITEERILKLIGNNQIKIIPFSKIYSFAIMSDRLYFKLSFPYSNNIENQNSYNSLHPPYSPYRLKEEIFDYWVKKYPYHSMNAPFKEIAEKYNLKFTPISLTESKIMLEGDLRGRNFKFILDGIRGLKKIKIEYSVLNEEKNYLYLRPEGLGDGIGKVLGGQDIKIGDSAFDKKFIIRSNNESFLYSILDEDMKYKINDALKYIKGSFILGIEEKEIKKNKPKINDTEDILDVHLLRNIEDEVKRIPNLYSPIVFKSLHLESLLNEKLIIKNVVEVLETFISLSQKLEDYN